MSPQTHLEQAPILTVAQIRACEQYTMHSEPIASIDLMERAGSSCAEIIISHILQHQFPKLFLFCGTGNNGGDGLVIARCLINNEISCLSDVTVVVCESKTAHHSSEMETNLERWKEITKTDRRAHTTYFSEQTPIDIPANALIIDALFGIGLNKPATGIYAAAIQAINKSDAPTISIDIPSGLFADQHTPTENNIVIASETYSIQFWKTAFLLPDVFPFCGKTTIVDIGIVMPSDMVWMQEILTKHHVSKMLRPLNPHASKGTFGHGLLIAGSADMPGAAILSATAALRGGIGKLTIHTAGKASNHIPMRLPEAILHPDEDESVISHINWSTLQKDINAIAVGPGIGRHRKTECLIKDLIDTVRQPMIFDADALNILADNKTWLAYLPSYSILTPHHKEFERLAGSSDNDFERMCKAREFAMRYQIVLILKGHHTLISTPDGTQFFNTTGNPGMATAGSGDTLTGLILSLLAQGYSPVAASILSVYIHGLAGDLYAENQSMRSMIATDISNNFGKAFDHLEKYNILNPF